MSNTKPLTFSCAGSQLYGLLEIPVKTATRALLIVVGGPQYRVGSHRQFLLLSRELASHGFPVMRFDQRGVGDSGGESSSFDNLNPDICAAIDTLCMELPSVEEIVIWGLCDAASAALMYAYRDPRVKGVVLLNPWVRSEQSLARSYLEQYYAMKFLSMDFWHRLLGGKVNLWKTTKSFATAVRSALGLRSSADDEPTYTSDLADAAPFQHRMRDGLREFTGEVLIILSGDDLTANEFDSLLRQDREWRRQVDCKNVRQKRIEHANHTFSKREWRDQVASWTLEWMRSW